MIIDTRVASWERDAQAMRRVRHEVFVVEQNVPPDLEWDGEDEACRHAIALIDGKCVGTGRLSPGGKIGRMAVVSSARGRGIGSALLEKLVEMAASAGMARVYLNAQTHALDFYARHGFVAEGPEFDEADIAHRRMVRLLSS
jgi:predicted GNAT family N-acyltransferase